MARYTVPADCTAERRGSQRFGHHEFGSQPFAFAARFFCGIVHLPSIADDAVLDLS
jgi:hypothetical protein